MENVEDGFYSYRWKLMMKLPLRVALAFFSAFILVSATQPAQALTYDRAAANYYAHMHSDNLNETKRNPDYDNLGDTDCTNFVSQILFAGGFPKITGSSNNDVNWFQRKTQFLWVKGFESSKSWVSVSALLLQLDLSGRLASITVPSMTGKYSGANISGGDLYMYDWGTGDGWSHLSYSTGRGPYLNFYDPEKKMNYLDVNLGSGDRMSQHSSDRDYAPWNWGFQTQTNPTIRAKMRTLVLKLNG
jgi:hypothetical protein